MRANLTSKVKKMTIKITVLQAHSHKFLEKKVMYHDRTMPKEKWVGKRGRGLNSAFLVDHSNSSNVGKSAVRMNSSTL